ncbi:MAG: hypothetical protein H7833_02410 [Magnetococcus sp. DMHC-1]|nr:hypothetical protein [Magnetococcales bacterium]
MNIDFSPIDEEYIKNKVKCGVYSSATELVCDAVRYMRHQDDSLSARLDAALVIGEQDIAAGRTTIYTPSLREQIEQDARQHARDGWEPDPDVVP